MSIASCNLLAGREGLFFFFFLSLSPLGPRALDREGVNELRRRRRVSHVVRPRQSPGLAAAMELLVEFDRPTKTSLPVCCSCSLRAYVRDGSTKHGGGCIWVMNRSQGSMRSMYHRNSQREQERNDPGLGWHRCTVRADRGLLLYLTLNLPARAE